MENEGGRDLVEGGALCERKNVRGVDPNRNWEVHWGFREKDYDPNEEFPGSRPFRCRPPRAALGPAGGARAAHSPVLASGAAGGLMLGCRTASPRWP